MSNPASMSFLAVVGVSAARRSNSFFSQRSQSVGFSGILYLLSGDNTSQCKDQSPENKLMLMESDGANYVQLVQEVYNTNLLMIFSALKFLHHLKDHPFFLSFKFFIHTLHNTHTNDLLSFAQSLHCHLRKFIQRDPKLGQLFRGSVR